MSGRNWSRWLGPPIAVAAIGLALSQFHAGAEAGGRVIPPKAGACTDSPITVNASGEPDRAIVVGSWWKLDERLDRNGALVSRQLVVGRGGSTTLLLDLPAESVASGPVRGVITVGADDGRASDIRLVSATGACSWLVDTSDDVVRGAILDPTDGSVLAHLVRRATRADLGTWRFGGHGALTGPVLIAPAIDVGVLDRPAWVTDLRLDATGHFLAVQSCTDAGCLTRVFDLRAPGPQPLLVPRARAGQDGLAAQGALLGFSGDRLITWASCSGFPCAVEAWDLASGRSATLVEAASAAALTRDGRFLLVTTGAQARRTLRIELGTGARALVKGIRADELLLPVGVAATSGLELADDAVAVGAPGATPRSFRPAAAEVIP